MAVSVRTACVVLVAAVLVAGCGGASETVRRTPGGTPDVRGLSQQRRTVVEEAHRWLGVPYAYGGSTRRGLDCSGLVLRVYEKIGIPVARTARDLFDQGRAVRTEKLRPGDLVFFQNTAGRGITHVGIYIGKSRFIHASTRKGVITSGMGETYYAQRYAGARALLP